jgi:hypothetical protein
VPPPDHGSPETQSTHPGPIGVRDLPQRLLTGPDGRVVAKDLEGDWIITPCRQHPPVPRPPTNVDVAVDRGSR